MRQGIIGVVFLVFAATCLICATSALARKDARRGRRGLKGGRDKHSIVWSRWSDWSECSRTCGGGAKYRTRHCVGRKPSNGKAGMHMCEEESRQYRTCDTKACPPGAQDFRAMQCAIYNEKPLVEWVPVEEGSKNECDLVCKTSNGAYELNFRHVIDGTRCRRDSMDMCINGKCQAVGCDGELNSTATFDVCGTCDGRNRSCGHVHMNYSDEYPSAGFYTYKRIVTIPSGASNIRINDKSQLNFIALKDESGEFLLNGDWAINWPGNFKGVGTTIVYQRQKDGAEDIRIEGPTDKSLEVMIIFRERNPGVEYEYWMPPSKPASHPRDQLLSDDIIADGEDRPSELSESEAKPESSSSSNVTLVDGEEEEEEEEEAGETAGEPGRESRRKPKKGRKGKNKRGKDGENRKEKCTKCRKVRGSRTSHFCENDFVLHVEILSKTIENGQTRFDTTVLQTYKNTVHLGRREYIWVPNVCKCPSLKTGGQYLVTGNRRYDTETGETRLVVDRDNLVSAWKEGYHKKWDKIQARESLVCAQGEEEETEGPTGRF